MTDVRTKANMAIFSACLFVWLILIYCDIQGVKLSSYLINLSSMLTGVMLRSLMSFEKEVCGPNVEAPATPEPTLINLPDLPPANSQG